MMDLQTNSNRMSRTTNPTPHDPARRKSAGVTSAQGPATGAAVCPFCGTVKPVAGDPCPRCTLEDTPATREATRQRIGPWHVLQNRNPTAPGMNFATLVALIKKGQVTPRSIVRGPTTYQLWSPAGRVKGLSREFGLCYACGQAIDQAANLCPHCHKIQEPPVNPDVFLENGPAAPAPTTAHPLDDVRPLPPRPLARPSGQEILTPKELAAAFSLSVADSATTRSPAALEVSPADAVDSGNRRFPYVVGTVLMLAAAGVAFWLLFDVQSRAKVQQWTRDEYATLRTRITQTWASFQKTPAPIPADDGATTTDSHSAPSPSAAGPAAPPRVSSLPPELQPLKPAKRLEPSNAGTSPLPPRSETPDPVRSIDIQPEQSTLITRTPSSAARPKSDTAAPSRNDAVAPQRPTTPEVATPPPPQAARQQPHTEDRASDTLARPAPNGAQSNPTDVGDATARPVRDTARPEPTDASIASTKLKPASAQPQDAPEALATATPSAIPSVTDHPVAPTGARAADRTAAAAPAANAPEKPQPQTAPTANGEDLDASINKARKLYWSAIDATANGDYRTAVKLYEQIQALPPDAWPSDLALRLNTAREQLQPRTLPR